MVRLFKNTEQRSKVTAVIVLGFLPTVVTIAFVFAIFRLSDKVDDLKKAEEVAAKEAKAHRAAQAEFEKKSLAYDEVNKQQWTALAEYNKGKDLVVPRLIDGAPIPKSSNTPPTVIVAATPVPKPSPTPRIITRTRYKARPTPTPFRWFGSPRR